MTKRPIGVWLICAYIALTFLSSLLSIGYAFLSDNPDVQWGRAYYQSLSIWKLGYLLLGSIVALSAAYALFTLRRIAAWLFSAVLVLDSQRRLATVERMARSRGNRHDWLARRLSLTCVWFSNHHEH